MMTKRRERLKTGDNTTNRGRRNMQKGKQNKTSGNGTKISYQNRP